MATKEPRTPGRRTNSMKVTAEIELMDFLLSKMGGMKRNSIKSMLGHRQIMVNRKVITLYNHALKPNDVVEVSNFRGTTELTHPKLKIVFEDKDLIVVEKKEGLLTIGTGTGKTELTAHKILNDHVRKGHPKNRVYVVHRIDRETSGLLLFAKNQEIRQYLQDYWHQVVTRRVYTALVEGNVEKDEETIRTWLLEHPKSLKVYSSFTDNGGKEAITHYKTIKRNENYSLLEIELETGRKNQIRVHLQQIGHPIVGDKKYGSKDLSLGRIGLHARVLEFIHPVTDKVVKFETLIPKEFSRKCNPRQENK